LVSLFIFWIIPIHFTRIPYHCKFVFVSLHLIVLRIFHRTRVDAASNFNFCGYVVQRGQRDGSLRSYSRFSRPEPRLFLSSRSSVVPMRLS
jgi:hypothetical protein